jgi:lactoylglutathione lyase
MQARLTYAIKFVNDMDKAVAWHRDVLGLSLRFASPGWSEFDTGATTLALHGASDKNPAGSVELGYTVRDLPGVYAARGTNGFEFLTAPADLHGSLLATIRDSEGAQCSLSGE